MGLSDRTKIDAAKEHLRREYPANRLDDLKQLARDVFAEASDTVTLTSGSYEGGSGSGQVTFDKWILLVAINERIAALDPDYVADDPRLSQRSMGITVRL